MAAKKKLDFEGSMTRLEEIVSLLERGDAPLEQAMALFEEGAKLLRECTAQLDQAEQKVMLLTAGETGEPEECPFQGDE
ncbi:exodeoxyribonuclease VII small subunit [Pseudoflavonifractor sp. AF19-9AC]|uniref:exodeoxyribonuclease VII small subunit n=1 Tax=Pseudoflavonifractor sp. AF19-9AC TaxID=2292244 RepID=UPI000E4FE87A|nr:exodeoxyribonuclease VII small subunit [Pseudoflavonifractor sp. AF19-9AC]RHR09017.1 exodeoxyribonuclease VII small subunit [Pseudoflavonifractor sp. AF19-9AC]